MNKIVPADEAIAAKQEFGSDARSYIGFFMESAIGRHETPVADRRVEDYVARMEASAPEHTASLRILFSLSWLDLVSSAETMIRHADAIASQPVRLALATGCAWEATILLRMADLAQHIEDAAQLKMAAWLLEFGDNALRRPDFVEAFRSMPMPSLHAIADMVEANRVRGISPGLLRQVARLPEPVIFEGDVATVTRASARETRRENNAIGDISDDNGDGGESILAKLRLCGQPILPLGIDRDNVCHYLGNNGRLVSMPVDRHPRGHLILLADKDLWANVFPGPKAKGDDGELKVDWMNAADWLVGLSKRKRFNMDKVRGRGAWIDRGRTGKRVVFHAGDHLIVDGEPLPLTSYEGDFIYPDADPMSAPEFDDPLSDEDMRGVLEVCQLAHWREPRVDPILLFGWICSAAVSGALPWRPHMWLSGKRGSGKSWLQANVISPFLKDIGFFCQGNTTEAGLRQNMRCDSRPVLFDEAEGENEKGARRIQSILEFARQSSSETDYRIYKGTQNGGGMQFVPRSSFLMSSIGVGLQMGADISRFTVLDLLPPPKGSKEEIDGAADRFAIMSALAAERITENRAPRFMARMIQRLPAILDAFEHIVHVALVRFLPDRRDRDQIGMLLACAWGGLHDGEATGERLKEWLLNGNEADQSGILYGVIGRGKQTLINTDSDGETCIGHILAHRLPITGVNWKTEASVANLILTALGADTPGSDSAISEDTAMRSLREIGLWPREWGALGMGLAVANSHPSIEAILGKTPWAKNWNRVLVDLHPEARPYPEPMKFTPSTSKRFLFIPLDAVLSWQGATTNAGE